jgi:hypothetical protein
LEPAGNTGFDVGGTPPRRDATATAATVADDAL